MDRHQKCQKTKTRTHLDRRGNPPAPGAAHLDRNREVLLRQIPQLPSLCAKGAGVREDFLDDKLIFGETMLALRALKHEFAHKVKGVFISPEYL